ncbi:hypothetical protein EZV62_017580 [Acer yangbiense]|uniref:Uncharacterized protein n=1 Tax=Acer yangbiense TaxID=1000413 RepID=A0A5C7HGY0_9ROSI|nr:hypothetical protein EZV62_017580 [Acer yangbiense]
MLDYPLNIVTDPDNDRVFKNIKEVISRKVLVDEGPRQVVELDQAAIWKFLWWSGTISVHVLVDQKFRTEKITEMLINDLLAETARIRRGLDTAKSHELEERCQ